MSEIPKPTRPPIEAWAEESKGKIYTFGVGEHVNRWEAAAEWIVELERELAEIKARMKRAQIAWVVLNEKSSGNPIGAVYSARTRWDPTYFEPKRVRLLPVDEP